MQYFRVTACLALLAKEASKDFSTNCNRFDFDNFLWIRRSTIKFAFN